MRGLLRLLCGSGLVLLAYLNLRLYYRPTLAAPEGFTVNQDLVAHLRFLRGQMHTGAAEDMQALYPGGFVYQNALYALSWTELLPHLPAQTQLGREARAETAWALAQLQSPAATAPFDADLPLPYGAFYQGWTGYVAGRYLAALPPAERPPDQIRRFEQQCAAIADALRASPTPYLESYFGAAWPADGVMGVAALAWHDRLRPARYQPDIRRWLRAVDQRLDARGLIPHEVRASTGQVLQAARGSSQSQLLNFLLEIDAPYARAHFRRYRRTFLTSRLGLPGVQEAPLGAAPVMDIDSGPVIWGVGGAASIVGRRTMQRYGDTLTALGLRNSIEAFGIPFHTSTGKRYLFGQLPIADAFIAWSNSLEATRQLEPARNWRGRFQLLSGVVAAVLLLGLRGRRSHPRPTGGA